MQRLQTKTSAGAMMASKERYTVNNIIQEIEMVVECEGDSFPDSCTSLITIYNITLILGTYNKIISSSKNLQSSITFAGKIIRQISVTSLRNIIQLKGSGKKNDTTIYMPVLI